MATKLPDPFRKDWRTCRSKIADGSPEAKYGDNGITIRFIEIVEAGDPATLSVENLGIGAQALAVTIRDVGDVLAGLFHGNAGDGDSEPGLLDLEPARAHFQGNTVGNVTALPEGREFLVPLGQGPATGGPEVGQGPVDHHQ